MSDTESSAPKSLHRDPAQELRAIGERRKALQEVVKITAFIARLHKALHAVLLMGQPATQIPKQVLQSYEKLSYQTQIRSNADLVNDLVELDKRAGNSLHVILRFATDDRLLGDHAVAEGIKMDTVFQQLGAFKRTVQTAVAIRLLLRERGCKATPLSLPIPLDEIQGRIGSLKAREQAKRIKMMGDIQAMIGDVDGILRHTGLDDALRAGLLAIKKDLEHNLAHLKAGRDIEQMPMGVEWVEMGAGETPLDKLGEEAAAPEQATEEKPPQPRRKVCFLRRLRIWLSTPLSVTWKDVNRRLQKEDNNRE